MSARAFTELANAAKADPVRRARIAQHKRAAEDALALAALREARGASQRKVAATLGVTQANVSRIEHEEDIYLSTLRRYVAALGGRLEINAVFDEEVIALVQAESASDR